MGRTAIAEHELMPPSRREIGPGELSSEAVELKRPPAKPTLTILVYWVILIGSIKALIGSIKP